MLASVSNLVIGSGVYPLVLHTGMSMNRRRLGKSNIPHAGRIAMQEWALALSFSALRPLGLLGLPGQKKEGLRPVILLHGYGMSRASYLWLAGQLSAKGLGPVLGFEYWTLGSIHNIAKELDAYIEFVCAKTGAQHVDLIGHSMGGIVGRTYLLSNARCASRVHSLVTLGSPHGGTAMAKFGLGHIGTQLHPKSDFLKNLNKLPEASPVTVIWSRSDPLVPSGRYGHLEGAEEIVFDDLGHLSLMRSKRIIDIIVERMMR